MKINSINSINNVSKVKSSNQNFKGGMKMTHPSQVLPREVIDRFSLNMRTRVGYQGAQDYTPAPDNVDGFFRKLKVNWATHVDPNKKRPMY